METRQRNMPLSAPLMNACSKTCKLFTAIFEAPVKLVLYFTKRHRCSRRRSAAVPQVSPVHRRLREKRLKAKFRIVTSVRGNASTVQYFTTLCWQVAELAKSVFELYPPRASTGSKHPQD
jgi:hypothetical protein